MGVLTEAIERARSAGRTAVIPFLTGGYPSREGFWRALDELAGGGADVIEVGVPFSDPVADGPVVAAAGLKALGGGANLGELLEGLAGWKGGVPLVLMSYANPLLQLAWERAGGGPDSPEALERLRSGAAPEPGIRAALRNVSGAVEASLDLLAGEIAKTPIKGVIVPDTPFEEAGPFRAAFGRRGLDLIPLVGPNTSLERMRLYEPTAGGYVYVVSVLGTTGVREGLPPEAVRTIARARSVFRLPVALGFGVKDPAQLAALGADPDAVIIGSALLRHLEAGGGCREFMAPWRG